MSAGDLKYTLVVVHPETGAPTPLVVGSQVPSWAKDLVHADDVEPGSAKAPVKPVKS